MFPGPPFYFLGWSHIASAIAAKGCRRRGITHGWGAMIVHHADRDIVKWAIDNGYVYEYVREYGLPEPSLRIHLGLSTAYFKAGQLIHWRADADASYMDQLMAELASLFGWCTQSRAYPHQNVFVSPPEYQALRSSCGTLGTN